MTGTFSWFTRPDAPIYAPGAPFVLAAVLLVAGVLIFVAPVRETVRRPPQAER